ncbi:hypothetical protein D3C83_105660 [compost metagenome]
MSTIFGPSVRISACSTLTICAIFAPRTRSAWRAKMLKLSAATIASRIEFCCWRKPCGVPGVSANHTPHSSTTSATCFSGS